MKIPLRYKRKQCSFGDDGKYYRSITEMAVVGPSRHTRVSMSLMQGPSAANSNSNVNGTNGTNSGSSNNGGNNGQAMLSASQNYYYSQPAHPASANLAQLHHFPADLQDRPIGYGAFGVVW